MANPKGKTVAALLAEVEDPELRRDAKALHALMKELTGLKPSVWSDSMIGYGSYRYRYASGREGEWFRIGFAPRARGLSLYLMSDFEGEEQLMQRIGKRKMGKCCMTFRRLSDLDESVLKELVYKSARGAIQSEV
ncbi:DUF1801 domain-containing protein [Pelagicoccus sp. SDUM812003]|uniref:DUF1801 domain-containing protein n=1 Tax=Pelagicoccus sp. SDUM812003 TaxID=3041267 RepID=UPI00281005DB|nr:DUF1801 domain-containing protein [Pelagicoccus sp. SDUM812003]MDQ8203716.1 DUF1801 domain-containing protein [Pelagicoccus sp. SDUM812003]